MATPIDRRTFERLQISLRTRHTRVADEIRKLNEALARNGGRALVDPTAGTVSTLTQEIDALRLHRLGAQLLALDIALDRLHRSEYGHCGDCGRFVGLERLNALPFTRQCRACQRKTDANGAAVRIATLIPGRRARPVPRKSAASRSA